MNYIVCYTLKHDETPDTFADRWMVFKEDEGCTIDTARKQYEELIEKDGGEEGWYLWTIALTQVIESTDY